MTDHQKPNSGTVAQNNSRSGRLGDFPIPGRSSQNNIPLEEGPANQNSSLTQGAAWIWGGSGLSTGIGGPFKAGNDDSAYRNVALVNYEQKQPPSSLLTSSDYDAWANSSAKAPLTWTDETSPSLSPGQLNEGLNRSPVRLRNSQHEPPQAATEAPRSTSPYGGFSRQAPVGLPTLAQSANNKGFLDPPAGFGETIGGRTLVQSFGGSRFSSEHGHGGQQPVLPNRRGAQTGSNALNGHMSPQHACLNFLTYANHLASESTYQPYQSIPTVQSQPHQPAHTPSYQQNFATARRYEDLTRQTTEAEVLAAQFRHMGVEPEEQEKIVSGGRRKYPPFTQASTTSSQFQNPQLAQPPQPLQPQLPQQVQQPQFRDFVPYSQQILSRMTHGQNSWGGGVDDSGYAPDVYGNDGAFAEGYGSNHMIYDNKAAGVSATEARSRSQHNPYLINGGAQTSVVELQQQQRSSAPSQQPTHIAPAQIMLQRDQVFPRPPYGLPYQYPPYGGIRIPVDPHFTNSPIGGLIPNIAVRRHDDGGFTHNLRSVLLEEFRSNSKSNKRYELKDIYNHVVEFSGDQHGSRFIQQKLETANSDEKRIVFDEIRANSLQLMTDVFGNYVIQKFFEHGNQVQKSILAKQMEGHVLTLSLQMYGCRVVQKALEHILVDQQASLVKELDGHVLKCVRDQNGNHVVQKAIERVPAEHIQFIIKAFTGQVQHLATHPYGCRVIQRMLEHCDETAQAAILAELHVCTYTLVQDQYGNYVTQHVIDQGKEEDRAKIIQLVTTQLLHFSKHKFASNVVEKSIAYGNDEQRREIVKVITTPRPDGSSPLQVLMRDQYGNYVIQKLLMQLKGEDREVLVDQIKPQLQALKKYTYAKQINAIEKLIYNSSSPNSQSTTPPPASSSTGSPSSRHAVQSPKSNASSSRSNPKATDGNSADKLDNAGSIGGVPV